MRNLAPKPVSPAQANFIRDLLRDRQPDEHTRVEAEEVLANGYGREASGIIDRLKNAPRAAQQNGNGNGHRGGMKVTEPGVYRLNGEVYVVKVTRATSKLDPSEWRFTASKVVEIGGERITEAGTFVNVEFEFASGVVWQIDPSDRMPFEDAKALTARYGRCIVCGAWLKAGKSVEAGIGPVCRKRFPDAAITAPVESDEDRENRESQEGEIAAEEGYERFLEEGGEHRDRIAAEAQQELAELDAA